MTQFQKDVRILLTGGTIDKVHDIYTEGLGFPDNHASHVPQLLAEGRSHFMEVSALLQKDSLDFTDEDREVILHAVQAAREDAVVITHGTGTMGTTARHLAGKVPGKTVVLTGAMRPWSLGRSDGPFNVGGAVIAAQCLPEGIWGIMNGRVFAAETLEKNTATGRFDG